MKLRLPLHLYSVLIIPNKQTLLLIIVLDVCLLDDSCPSTFLKVKRHKCGYSNETATEHVLNGDHFLLAKTES